MPFTVQPVTESDGEEWTRIYYFAFQSTLAYLWRGEPTDDGWARMAGEHIPTLKEPDVHTFKAVDTISNKMVGVAQWQIFKQTPSQETLDSMFVETSPPPEINHEARTALLKDIAKARTNFMPLGPCILLRMLIVSPDYQRKGAGNLLMQWGVEQMNQLGIRGYLESSIHGKGLYEKFEFNVVREIEFDSIPWGSPTRNTHFVMIREPKITPSN